MNSKEHSAFTGDKAVVSAKVGGTFSVWSGFITGKNIKLIKNKKIVQAWKSTMDGWPAKHYSTVTFALQKTKTGTKLVFTHKNIPASCAKDISKGWKEYYWKPMKKYFSQR